MNIQQLSEIVGEVLDIHSEPINDPDTNLELTMSELLQIVENSIKSQE